MKENIYRFLKRTADIFISFILLILFSWLFLILAILVKCTSKGPVFFKDKRVGFAGKDITIYKFRTMFVDSEGSIEKYLTGEQLEEWKKERKIQNDPRITKLGRFLRKSSLDELPQLLNVLGGTLSICGNRPITRNELNMWYSDEQKKLLFTAKPGITGYWQVYGRSEVTFESGDRQKLDIYYVKHRSLWLDLKIFFMTPFAVLAAKGAK